MVAEFEQFTVSVSLFFTWILRIYIILGAVSHSLHVFGFYIAVCSHMVGMHSSSGQVT